MKHWMSFLTLSVVSLVAVSGLTGCGGFSSAASLPDVVKTVPLGTIQGNDFGGHAPLVGAHIYVLQPGLSGYASQATSLLTASSSGAGYPTTLNVSDKFIPNTWYYVTTDQNGVFTLSGDYSCVAGQPVYLYGAQGAPTYPSASAEYSASQVVVSDSTGSSATLTFTVTSNELFYEGENLFLYGFPSPFAAVAGVFPILVPTVANGGSLSNLTFSVTASGSYTNGTYTSGLGSGVIIPEPQDNLDIVNLAMLGVCPDDGGGTGNFSNLSYVYLNEVSTVAMAYAFQGFTSSANNDVTHIGSSSDDLGGLNNAALTAGQLYDIQGGSLSTSYAGEGHIAQQYTTSGGGQINGGNGIIPQALIDTLGDVLAACVDSEYDNPSNGTYSPQCTTLFNVATNTGIPSNAATDAGQFPYDTATAAVNIARNPAGGGTATQRSAYMSTIYSLPTGNVPFTPNLVSTGAGQPNDFMVAIKYPQSGTPTANSFIQSPESIASDGYGNVWFDNNPASGSGHSVVQFSPLGLVSHDFSYGTTIATYVSIDPGSNAWVGTGQTVAEASGVVTEFNEVGTALNGTVVPSTGMKPTGGHFALGYADATDGLDNYYIGDANLGTGYRISEISTAGAVNSTKFATVTPTCYGALTTAKTIDHAAVDSVGNGYNLWTTGATGGVVCKMTTGTTPAVATGFPVSVTSPEFISIDSSGNAWIPSGVSGAGSLYEVSPTGTLTTVTSASSGATFKQPYGSAIDGADNIWVAMEGSGSFAEFNASGIAISPSTNYTAGNITANPYNITFDPSGNLWATDKTNNDVVEIIGASIPPLLPLSYAGQFNLLGQPLP
jgi:hypothetical protein